MTPASFVGNGTGRSSERIAPEADGATERLPATAMVQTERVKMERSLMGMDRVVSVDARLQRGSASERADTNSDRAIDEWLLNHQQGTFYQCDSNSAMETHPRGQ